MMKKLLPSIKITVALHQARQMVSFVGQTITTSASALTTLIFKTKLVLNLSAAIAVYHLVIIPVGLSLFNLGCELLLPHIFNGVILLATTLFEQVSPYFLKPHICNPGRYLIGLYDLVWELFTTRYTTTFPLSAFLYMSFYSETFHQGFQVFQATYGLLPPGLYHDLLEISNWARHTIHSATWERMGLGCYDVYLSSDIDKMKHIRAFLEQAGLQSAPIVEFARDLMIYNTHMVDGELRPNGFYDVEELKELHKSIVQRYQSWETQAPEWHRVLTNDYPNQPGIRPPERLYPVPIDAEEAARLADRYTEYRADMLKKVNIYSLIGAGVCLGVSVLYFVLANK